MAIDEKAKENWGSASPYELYVGRWSRKVGLEFLNWISVPAKSAWADVGCGTGALTEAWLTGAGFVDIQRSLRLLPDGNSLMTARKAK